MLVFAALPEVVGNAAELVDPWDVNTIVSGVFRVITDKARRDELIGLGHYQENKYTWEASADRLRAVCREVLEEK